MEPNVDRTFDQQDPISKIITGQEFIFDGSGSMIRFKPDPNNLCEKMYEIECTGFAVENTLGRFSTFARICCDYGAVYSVEGSHIFQNKGDEIFFHSDKWGIDDGGNFWMIYEYYGGTGIFEGVTGTATVYEIADWTSYYRGTYVNHGEGTISFK
jgi:hypothetical protein